MSEICSTCLSINRKLFPLDQNKYQSLFDNKAVIENVNSVCWECNIMFHKLLKFKLQVLQAQECLRKTLQQVTNLSSLSHLSYSHLNFHDVCCDNFDNYITNIKLETNIESTHNEYNENDFGNYLIDINSTKNDTATLNDEAQVDIVIKNENYETSNDIAIEDISIATTKIKKTTETNISNVKTIKNVNVEKRKNFKKRVRCETKSEILKVTKENYIIIEMSEEEMQARREIDKQADRYKNKVKYRCELCIVGFFHKELYDQHMRNRHPEKPCNFQCNICQTSFTKTNYFKEHMLRHYRKYKCFVCGYIGYKLSEMINHDAKVHDFKRFICKICKGNFPSPATLRFHRETVHDAPSKCEFCAKTFTTKNGLRVHIQQVHSHKPKSPCVVCGARVRYMRSHMRTHCAAPEAAYCAECDQRFASAVSYKAHLKYASRHRADTVLRHACRLCDAKFVNSTSLKKHTAARHLSVRPFKCDTCGKGFEAQYKLKLHIKHAHEGVEKPKDNICHICGRGFNTKFMLSNHIRVHTGEKPFRCSLCAAAFSQKSSLTTHTRGVHLKIKPRQAPAV